MFDAAPDEVGSSRGFIATAALAVGLLTGFAGGYVTGQRQDRVPAVPIEPAATEDPSLIATPALDVPAQSYTENPVPEAPEVVATAEVAKPPVPRASSACPAIQPRTGLLFVVSRPTGAEVFLDERPVGMTPLSLSDVPAGTHAVRIALPDHQRWATTVTLMAGASERVAASLER